jgi:hypothetical protein
VDTLLRGSGYPTPIVPATPLSEDRLSRIKEWVDELALGRKQNAPRLHSDAGVGRHAEGEALRDSGRREDRGGLRNRGCNRRRLVRWKEDALADQLGCGRGRSLLVTRQIAVSLLQR